VSDARFRRVETLFNAAVDLSPEARRAFLLRECGDDPELLATLETMLQSEVPTRRFSAVVDSSASTLVADASLAPGDCAGTYRILKRIGEGGMGVVYLATRADALYEQRVAVKVINRLAGASADIQRRFQDERQILANLKHPNIVHLLDGGSLVDGSPFLVMEYVDGERIDHWCHEQSLSVDGRLALFIKVCKAVQHAHQNLVVHRDLKPSNVLIGTDGEPKLMDFGVARIMKSADEELNPQTRLEERVLTPRYASPEQLSGAAVSTVSDVYSLGVLLFELLVGRRPFDDPDSSDWSYARRVVEDDPPLPSRVDAAAPKGDLDNILLMALARDPHRRYQSAGALARDLERYLQRRPVTACSPSLAYLATRFVQRNQLASALMFVFVLAVGSLASALVQQAGLLQEERDYAREQLARTTAVLSLIEGMFKGLAPDNSQGETVTVQQVLDRTGTQLINGSGRFASAPAAVNAVLHRIIGSTYNDLGIIAPGRRHLEAAMALHQKNTLEDDAERLRTINALSQNYHLGFEDQDLRLRLNEEALALSRRLYGPRSEQALAASAELASSYHLLGRLEEGRALYDETYRGRRELLGTEHPDTLRSLSRRAVVDYWMGNYDEALADFEYCESAASARLGATHTLTLQCLERRGLILETMGRHAEAVEALAEHVGVAGPILGPTSPSVLRTQHSLADAYRGLGQYARAEEAFLQVLALRREALGTEHIETLQSEMKLARVYRLMRRYEEATFLITHAVEQTTAQYGFDHPSTLIAAQEMAELLLDSRQLERARDLLLRILSARESTLGDDHPDLESTLVGLSRVAQAGGRLESARGYLSRALTLLESHPTVMADRREQLRVRLAALTDGPLLSGQSRPDGSGVAR
jgi:serine/threonine-protein kinase